MAVYVKVNGEWFPASDVFLKAEGEWRSLNPPPPQFNDATGGVVSEYRVDGRQFRVHQFTASDTFTVLSCDMPFTYLVVGGGGGAGSNSGGGGGGGEVVEGTLTLTKGAKTVTVGQGGAASTADGPSGINGQPSVFDTITALGGGGGAGRANVAYPGGKAGGAPDAATGGGGSGHSAGDVNGGTGIPGKGFNGGNGGAERAGSSGGGGGAGGPGVTAPSNTVPGEGGVGKASAITGSEQWFGGGGTGAVNAGTTQFPGGKGGGGYGVGVGVGGNGVPNTGGGGGGTGDAFTTAAAGSGGSGFVAVAYEVAYVAPLYNDATGGTVTEITVDGKQFRVHTFTASDTLEVLASHNPFRVLAVGGGGGGGNGDNKGGGDMSHRGGAPGGNGQSVDSAVDLTVGSVPVVVGAGGDRDTHCSGTPQGQGGVGGVSSIGTVTAAGGDFGKQWKVAATQPIIQSDITGTSVAYTNGTYGFAGPGGQYCDSGPGGPGLVIVSYEIEPPPPPSYNDASGGTVTEVTIDDKLYRRHTFDTVGTSTFSVAASPNNFEVLVVAAGGGGGWNHAYPNGGGGGGGGAYFGPLTLPAGDHAVVVPGAVGTTGSGGDASIGALVCGGGGAGNYDTIRGPAQPGRPGANGGGRGGDGGGTEATGGAGENAGTHWGITHGNPGAGNGAAGANGAPYGNGGGGYNNTSGGNAGAQGSQGIVVVQYEIA